jgi:uncharacterized membrane protein
MGLPEISIPTVDIPFDIHPLLHPSMVHFAIAIPLLVIVAEILNLILKGKGVKIVSSIIIFLLIVILFMTYLTGVTDAKVATDSGFTALGELKEHKLLGIYLFYGSIFLFILKMISLGVNKTGFRVFYILVLFGFLAGIIYQGKRGGELVYKYGANVQTHKKVSKKTKDEDSKKTEQKTTKVKTEKEKEKKEKEEKEEKNTPKKEPAKESINTQPQAKKQDSKKEEQNSSKEDVNTPHLKR